LQVEFLSWDGRYQPRTHPEAEGLGPAVHGTEIPGPWLCSDAIHWTESSPSLDSVLREGRRVRSTPPPPALSVWVSGWLRTGFFSGFPKERLCSEGGPPVVRAGLSKPAPRLPRCLLKRPVETEQSPRKAGVKLALVIPAYKTFWEFGFAFSLSRVLEMVTDRTGPLTFSPFRWQVAFVSRVEENVLPCARRTYGAGCVRVVPCSLMLF